MIVGGGLRVSHQFVRSYALISITTLPPAMSFIFTYLKFEAIHKLSTPRNENSEHHNAESIEQDTR